MFSKKAWKSSSVPWDTALRSGQSVTIYVRGAALFGVMFLWKSALLDPGLYGRDLFRGQCAKRRHDV